MLVLSEGGITQYVQASIANPTLAELGPGPGHSQSTELKPGPGPGQGPSSAQATALPGLALAQRLGWRIWCEAGQICRFTRTSVPE